jgi:hypothetical protein
MAEEQATQEQANSELVVVEASTPADKVPYEIELPEDAEGRVSASFNFPIGKDLQEDIEMYGAETIRDLWLRQAVVKGQSAIRRELQNGTHPGDIPEQLSGWRPDITHTTTKDPKTSIKQEFKKLSAEERAEILAMLEEDS